MKCKICKEEINPVGDNDVGSAYDYLYDHGYCSSACLEGTLERKNNVNLIKTFIGCLNRGQLEMLEFILEGGMLPYYHYSFMRNLKRKLKEEKCQT